MFLTYPIKPFNSSISDDILVKLLAKNLVYPGKTSHLLPSKKTSEKLKAIPNNNGYKNINGLNIFWRVIEPANYNIKASWPNNDIGFSFPEISFNKNNLKQYKSHKGVVVFLHGWMMNGDCMLPWALKLASEGYRCICVDLRNHGKSSVRRAGYGLYESVDTSMLIDKLKEDKIIDMPFHLFGISYGAATSLFTASIRNDVKSVISIESFSNAKKAIKNMVPHLIYNEAEIKPTPLDFLNKIIINKFNDEILQEAIKSAENKIGFDLDDIRPSKSLGKVKSPLIIHSTDDMHVKIEHGRELSTYAPHGKYVEIIGENHLTLPARLDLLLPIIIDWIEKQ